MTDRNWDFKTRAQAGPPVYPRSSGEVPYVVGPPTADRPATVLVPAVLAASSPSAPPGSGSKWGWRALVAFVAGGLLAGSGFGAALLTNRLYDPESVIVSADARGNVAGVGSAEGGDPAAAVAAILGPSVVKIETDIGLGSGVVYADGLIVTNNHVIEGASVVSVKLSDGRTLPAEIVGADPRTDVAVIAAGKGLGLTVAALAVDQPLEVGELTVAIGSPFDLQQTVTSGIVSAINRPVFNGSGYNAMIQTDAAINPGNSGGALANRAGQVIGINTAIQTDGQSNTNAGIGFAMPITTVAEVAERIVNGEPLDPGFLGVHGIEPTNGAVGVEVDSIEPGSAAEANGLRLGDIIVSINGAPVTKFEELAGLIQTSFPGEAVELSVVRGNETISLTATLGER